MRGNSFRKGGGGFNRRKVCRFCVEPKLPIDYKEPAVLMPFLTDRGKIIPRRVSGNCAKHQRQITTAVKQSRQVALLPYINAMGE